MKKLFAALLLILTLLLGGCAKGHITLQVSRLGAAELTCQLMSVPVLKPTVDSFQEDFRKDGYRIREAAEGDYSGFIAHKHYNQLKDIKDSKVLKTFDFKTWQKAAQSAARQGQSARPAGPVNPSEENGKGKPVVTMQGGLLFDTIAVKTGIDMGETEDVKNKDAQAMLKNILKQFDLQFTLILPAAVDATNAPKLSDDRKTLTWKLPLGEKVPLEARVTYLNPVKAAGWVMVVLVVGSVIAVYTHKKRRRKAVAALLEQEDKKEAKGKE